MTEPTTTFEWTFPALEVDHTHPEHPKLITLVHWRLKATWGDFVAETIGTIPLGDPGQPYTSFDGITHDMIQQWTEDAINAQVAANGDVDGLPSVDDYKANLEANIMSQIAPPVETVAPPFA